MNTFALLTPEEVRQPRPGSASLASKGPGRGTPFLSRENVGRRRAGRHASPSLSATPSAARLTRIRTVRAGGVTGPDAIADALLLATGSGLRSEPPRASVRAGRFLALPRLSAARMPRVFLPTKKHG